MQTYEVHAHWDADAKVWWAESNDVPGLAIESPSADGLLIELRQLVPELLEMNNRLPDERPLRMRFLLDETEDLP